MATMFFLFFLLTLTFVKLLIQAFYLIHKLQQFGYFNLKFLKWLEGNKYRVILLWNIFELLFPLLIILIFFYFTGEKNIAFYKYVTSLIMIVVFSWKIIHPFLAGWVGPKSKTKKKLVFTSRVIRLFFTFILTSIIILTFAFFFTAMPIDEFTLSSWNFFKFNAFLLFVSIIAPLIVIVSNFMNLPIEKFIQFVYFTKAKNKLKNSALTNICITGSYGKTSAKFFTATLLKEKYKTLFTPSSFNTPMGISKIINTENLSNYKYFVCEMGADHKGDINILCKLVNPNFGILTSIDIQHLETFGTLQNIISTKLSLLKNVNKNGFAIYNYDSEILKESIKNCYIEAKLFSYSIFEENLKDCFIVAKEIKHTRGGLEFIALFKSGEIINVKTKLLGLHNVSNLLAAILCSKLLGLSIEDIEKGLKKIEPVEHRLQLIDSGSGVLVLDDAFNSNIKGAFEALRVLKEIEGGKKIIITPGIIELGEKQDEINHTFGRYISQFADVAILVGKNQTKKILSGLKEMNFNDNNIKCVASLNEAQEILKEIVRIGDVVLFENDLPDTYSE